MKYASLALLLLPALAFGQPAQPTALQNEFFENNIRPVLAQDCQACHNDTKAGGLRLMSREDILKGGASGPAVVPGEPDKSLLIAKIRQNSSGRMPLGGRAAKRYRNKQPC